MKSKVAFPVRTEFLADDGNPPRFWCFRGIRTEE